MIDFNKSKRLIERFHQAIGLQWINQTGISEQTLNQALTIQSIPAPTFDEYQRANYVRDAFVGYGLADIDIDDLGNVYGRLNADYSTQQPTKHDGVMVVAHTDTVFPHETDLTVQYKDDRIYGAGLGDNSLGVAGLLSLIDCIQQLKYKLARDIWFVATTREEGLGDLGGMRGAFERLKDQIGAVLNIEGMSYGYIYHEGIAVRRLKVTAHAEGGHSWANFGHTSAIHGIVQLGAKITALKPPNNPRTTYNIGVIEGGTSINTIATEASFALDMRSESSEALAIFEGKIRDEIKRMTTDKMRFDVEIVGDRPSGQIAVDHPYVKMSMRALELVGTKGLLATGSTDGNISLAGGCPTVTLGVTTGDNAHRLDEYIQADSIPLGIYHMVLVLAGLALVFEE
jgi:tripeptide aminopeptidase